MTRSLLRALLGLVLLGLVLIALLLAGLVYALNVRGEESLPPANAVASAPASPGADRPRRLPRARRQLHGLPHGARRCGVCRRGAACRRRSARSTHPTSRPTRSMA